jgi:hypothetical protein
LVLTRGLDTVTQFFNRVKLNVIPIISIPDFYFHVKNIGKNTATNLRAELFIYPNSVAPEYFQLSWRMEDVLEPIKEASLSYLRSADAFYPGLTLRMSGNQLEFVQNGISIRRSSSLNQRRICDVTLHIFGEYGIERQEYLWLVATGDASNPLSFEKAVGNYRLQLRYLLVRLLRFVLHQMS